MILLLINKGMATYEKRANSALEVTRNYENFSDLRH